VPQIRTSTAIRAPREAVYRYATTPANWPRWRLNSLAVSGSADHSPELGERITEEIRIGRRTGQVTWTVVEKVVPSRWAVTGRVVGGGEGTLTYSFSERDGVTEYRSDLDYRMPTLLLRVMDRLLLRARLRADARRSLQRLRELLEGGQAT
jgi:uncharacterized protein YndB with AHSA1/START domain